MLDRLPNPKSKMQFDIIRTFGSPLEKILPLLNVKRYALYFVQLAVIKWNQSIMHVME